jgi:hypothetical protein
MNKIIVLLAVLATSGCAEAVGDVALIGGGAAHAGGGNDVASTPAARAVAYESAPREVVSHRGHHDGDFVVCAQCRR